MSKLFCTICGTAYPLNTAKWRCSCGGVFSIRGVPDLKDSWVDESRYDVWRYRRAIACTFPLGEEGKSNTPITLGEGWTPLQPFKLAGGRSSEILVKHDHIMPTGSFKDRGAAVLLNQVRSIEVSNIVEDSSGNAGAAVAAYAAAAGIRSKIYIPDSTSKAKIRQIEAYGAEIIQVPGAREASARAALEAAENSYYASHSRNPFFFEGTKTAAYEIAEQLDWRVPDTVLVPCGNGTLLLGLYRGFSDLYENGICASIPKLIALQSSACSPVYDTFHAETAGIGKGIKNTVGTSIASGIAVAEPVRLQSIVDAVIRTKGTVLSCTDDEIAAACGNAWSSGLYIEETAAVSLAGAIKYLDLTDNNKELIVVVATGHGLKRTGK